MTVNLTPKSADALSRSAQREEISRTDVVNRALQMYDYLRARMVDQGTQVLLRSADGAELERLTIL